MGRTETEGLGTELGAPRRSGVAIYVFLFLGQYLV